MNWVTAAPVVGLHHEASTVATAPSSKSSGFGGRRDRPFGSGFLFEAERQKSRNQRWLNLAWPTVEQKFNHREATVSCPAYQERVKWFVLNSSNIVVADAPNVLGSWRKNNNSERAKEKNRIKEE